MAAQQLLKIVYALDIKFWVRWCTCGMWRMLLPSLVPRPLYARGVRFLLNKGLVSTVLRMCQFKTNEYTQTTLLGVELLPVTFYV